MTESDDTRSELLDAAYTVLFERGYDGFTTQAVADEAGRNQSLVHYHFNTKQNLLRALVEHSLGNLEEKIRARADDDDPLDRLLTLGEYMIVSDDEAWVALKRVLLELRAQAPYDDDVGDVMARDRAFIESFVAETVREGIEGGQFRDVDVEAFAAAFTAAVVGAQTTTAAFGEDAGGVTSGETATTDEDVASDETATNDDRRDADRTDDDRTTEQRAVAGLRDVAEAHLLGEDV